MREETKVNIITFPNIWELTYTIIEAHKICSQQARVLGEPVVYSSSPKASSGHRSSQRSNWVPRQENNGPAQDTLKGRILSHSWENLFVLLCSTDWISPTQIGKSNLLYPVYQLKCSCHLETPSQTNPDTVWPNAWVLHGPVRLTYKYHTSWLTKGHI